MTERQLERKSVKRRGRGKESKLERKFKRQAYVFVRRSRRSRNFKRWTVEVCEC